MRLSLSLSLSLLAAAALPAALAAQPAHSAAASSAHGAHGAHGASTAARTAADAGIGRVVTVRTLDYAFEAPASIPAGLTTFRIENAGKELHHVWLVRLEKGKTAADYLAALEAAAKGAPIPRWAVDVGGPNAAVPGLLADGTIALEAGNYLMICHIPSPGDGKPHSMKGMFKPLTVTAAPVARQAARTVAPKADVTMTLDDYDFRLSAPLVAGRRTIEVTNAATQPHEVFFAKLAPGKTVADAAQWLEAGMQGPPPIMPAGGTAGLARGRVQRFTSDFTPGEYALFCFVPDAKDGKPHIAHGMLKQITVAER